MFYLKVFFKSLFVYRWKGISFLLTSVLMLYLSLGSNHLKNFMRHLVQVDSKRPYFNVLIDDRGLGEATVAKVKKLPGVEEVVVKSHKDLQKNLKRGIELLQTQLPAGMKELNYYAFKVVLEPKSSKKTRKLIREYINKLVGGHVAVMSEIISPKQQVQQVSVVKVFFFHYGQYILMGTIMLFWLLTAILFTQDFRKYCYLIEEFQRRQHVAIKGLLSFFALLILIEAPIIYSYQRINFYSLILMAAVTVLFSLLTLKNYRWNSR